MLAWAELKVTPRPAQLALGAGVKTVVGTDELALPPELPPEPDDPLVPPPEDEPPLEQAASVATMTMSRKALRKRKAVKATRSTHDRGHNRTLDHSRLNSAPRI